MTADVRVGRSGELKTAKLLLVEGPDEYHFFTELVKKLDMPDLTIISYDGKDNFGNFVATLPKASGFRGVRSIGVVRDADEDANRAFQSVVDGLKLAGLPQPARVLLSSQSNPNVTVAVVPPGESRGALEEMCLHSVVEDPAISCVDEYVRCLQSRVPGLSAALGKVKLHAFLASRPSPDAKLGEATRYGYWPLEHIAFADIIAFVKGL